MQNLPTSLNGTISVAADPAGVSAAATVFSGKRFVECLSGSVDQDFVTVIHTVFVVGNIT